MITQFFKPVPKKVEKKEESTSSSAPSAPVSDTVSKKRSASQAKLDSKDSTEKDEPSPKRAKAEKSNLFTFLTEAPKEEEKSQYTQRALFQLLDESWHDVLKQEFIKPYFKGLCKRLAQQEKAKKQIFPPPNAIFKAFEHCKWDDLRVVILGQDPYHDVGQAEGLCFSVPAGMKLPSSLRNMIKELKSDDVEFETSASSRPNGHLANWAKQGVLLLNTVLTVNAHQANSHSKFGWQQFTDAVIRKIAVRKQNVVFILWGKQAQKKCSFVNRRKHCIVESAHPSGLSASRGFFGSKPFSKTNAYLKEHDLKPIDWQV